VIARQEQELDQLRSAAAARSLADLARGMLMERLGCSPAEATDQLAHLAKQSGVARTELAAQITGEVLVPGQPGDVRLSRARAAIELSSDEQGMAAALLDETLAPAGAVAVAIWLLAPDGGLDLAGEAGLGPAEASRWRRIPPGMNTVPQRAAEEGAEVWWPGGRPVSDAATPVVGRWPSGARAVLPLHSPGGPGSGPVLGALEVCWPEPLPEFPEPLRRQLAALARMTAETLGTSPDGTPRLPDYDWSWLFGLLEGLQESVLFAQAIRDASGSVADFRIVQVSHGFRDPVGRPTAALSGRSLTQAYPAASRPGNLLDLALQVHASGEPAQLAGELAAGFPIQHVRMARLFDGVVIAWRQAADIEGLATLLEHAQRLGRIGGWEENLATGVVRWTEPTFALFGKQPGQPVPLTELHRRVAADDVPAVRTFQQALLQRKTAAATAFRIIRADDGSLRQIRAFAEPVTDAAGTLIAVRGAYQDVSAQYHTEVALAATRDQLASTEERAADERRLAVRLQEAIIPPSSDLTETAGLDVAARYRPAARDHLVSGDWYDTVLLPAGQVLLAIGDIAGHGIDAVTGMVSLRNGLRALAITGAGPATLLGWLNQAAYHTTTDMATAICGLYDPQTHALRWARAGHLPPVLVRSGKAVRLPEPQGALLGADPDGRYEEVTTALKPGDTLVLFTDGLIERRTQTIDEALDAFLAVASQPAADASRTADLLLARASSDTGDDACLITAHIR
jgi:PAS domain-containing protein